MVNIIALDENYDVKNVKFNLLISALGFESRCSFIAKELYGNYEHGYCLKFPKRQQLAFSENKLLFEKFDFLIEEWTGELNREKIKEYIQSSEEIESNKLIKVAIDISSMNRVMVAELIYTFSNEIKTSKSCEISILYAPAEYKNPPDILPPMCYSDHVLPEYAGWYDNPSAPLYAVVGLGYEYGKASGVIEYLEVSGEWLLKPNGFDERYLESIDKVNQELISKIENHRILSYKLGNPYETFSKVKSLVEGLLRQGRVILIPLGPKLFNLICIIIAEYFSHRVSVWRVSADDEEEPVDHIANGQIVSFVFGINEYT